MKTKLHVPCSFSNSLIATHYSSIDIEAGSSSHYESYSHIGCDETGSTDFFGPLCIVSCYIDERDIDWLESLNLRDPKSYTDQETILIARELKDRLIYSLLILDNTHYNQMANEGKNLANIKAQLYNQAITNVMQKTQLNVTKKVITQFVSPKTYFNYLKSEVIVVKDVMFQPKEEIKFYGIICSGILSRYAYLQYYGNMCKSLKVVLPRGTGTNVEQVAYQLTQKFGDKMINKVAKMNFTNYKRLKVLLDKNA